MSTEGVLEFAIDVQFPVIRDGGIVQVKAFETDLPMFSHHVKRLEKKVRFESVSLFSQNMPIQSDVSPCNRHCLPSVAHEARAVPKRG